MLSILGIVIFLASLFLGRWLNEKAILKLSEEDRTKLVEGLARYRLVSLAGVIAIVVAYWGYLGMNYSESVRDQAFSAFVVALIVFMIAGTAYVFYKLKRMKIDEDYISSFMLSTAVQHVGLIGFVFLYRSV